MSEPSLYLSLPHPRRYSTRMIDPKKASEAENAESRGSQEENSDTNQTEADKPQGLLGWISRIPQLFSFGWLYAIPFICLLGVGGVLIYVSQVDSLASCSESHVQYRVPLHRQESQITRPTPTWSRSAIG